MKITTPTVNAPSWVELGTSDPEAARVFYHELFGWRVETDTRPEIDGYSLLWLGDAPVAAITAIASPKQSTAWLVCFAVSDAEATAAAVADAGGTVLRAPTDVSDEGRFAVLGDPSGAVFTIWQAKSFKGAGVLNEPGSLGWVELATRDTEGAKEFYSRVFGWSVTIGEMYTQWGLDGRDFGGMLDMGDQFPAEVAPYWMPYFAVADVDSTAERAAALGATVMLPPTDVPEGPRLAVLHDAQGARFGIHIAGTEG
ncbi:VOC family protein [Kitasatospora sp. GP82]|uniref:VOC family protein n=1 Tax=Kitasatospora sp. GP82 TaxID=3035089 RepID=UPI0024743847|nr:VOC family protein [Kitasatospora sp. GP82]MDH6125361.1 putative enzyme related to lactoylglutathione lyase [Kitasatospora sp. GP82]